MVEGGNSSCFKPIHTRGKMQLPARMEIVTSNDGRGQHLDRMSSYSYHIVLLFSSPYRVDVGMRGMVSIYHTHLVRSHPSSTFDND
jgi:hypothetical protein